MSTNRLVALLIVVAVVGLSACGADGENEPAAAEVERSLRAELASGGGGVVNLDGSEPKEITCRKDPDREDGWRCTVRAANGRSFLCIVSAGGDSGEARKRVCGPVDY